MTKLYIITYNPTEPFNKGIFHNYIQSLYQNGKISDWFHYLDETYIVASNLDVTTLYNLTFPGVPKRYLLIIEVNANNAQGWLPQGAWNWLQKYKSIK